MRLWAFGGEGFAEGGVFVFGEQGVGAFADEGGEVAVAIVGGGGAVVVEQVLGG